MAELRGSPGGLASMPDRIELAKPEKKIDWKRILFLGLGLITFIAVYYSPPWPDAVDPAGKHFVLTTEGKGALALFLLAMIWWVFEVVPIGVTSVAIGVVQALYVLRSPRDAFTDFMDPSVWFIFGSLIIGIVFTKTGLTQRMAYKMLALVGERTSMIYLGAFMMVGILTLVMAHTAVAATVFPLLMAINSLYEEDDKPTKFGKGLFMGMAYTAGAGSVVTLLGAARGAVAIGFFKEIASGPGGGREITFFELSYYMAPLGWGMIILLWLFFLLYYRPEKRRIPGLRERARMLYSRLGPMKREESLSLLIVLAVITILSLRSFIPALKPFDKSAIILGATVLFFVLKILTVKDLEELPWNIILLFGGAMSIGFCLWKAGTAEWMAVHWLTLFKASPWFIFVMGIAFFVMIMTNFIMNVAAIAISLPVALVIAPYLKVAPEVILYASLAAAGMPFLTLIGAAPNAIAYGSGQFTSGQFFKAGVPASILLMLITFLFVMFIWPLMGMPVTMP